MLEENLNCDETCLCYCGVELFQEGAEVLPAAMDPDMLNATLAALAANQQQQQHQFQLQQQQMQQQF
jgi:hypothetical protein